MPGGPQRAQAAGVARSVDAGAAVEAALPSAPRPMPSLRGAGGGLSLGRALGASDDVAGECGGETGAGDELAGDGAPLWTELEGRGNHHQAGGAIRVEEPGAACGACDWHG